MTAQEQRSCRNFFAKLTPARIEAVPIGLLHRSKEPHPHPFLEPVKSLGMFIRKKVKLFLSRSRVSDPETCSHCRLLWSSPDHNTINGTSDSLWSKSLSKHGSKPGILATNCEKTAHSLRRIFLKDASLSEKKPEVLGPGAEHYHRNIFLFVSHMQGREITKKINNKGY